MSVQQYCYVGPYLKLATDTHIIIRNDYNNGDDFAEKFEEELFFRPLDTQPIYIPQEKDDWSYRYSSYYDSMAKNEVIELSSVVICDALHLFKHKYYDVIEKLKSKGGLSVHYGVINYMF